MITKNPHMGQEDKDGTYYYKQGEYGIRYRVLRNPAGRESVEWIYSRRRLGAHGGNIKKISNYVFKFKHYQGWLIFLRFPILFLLLASILIIYFGLIETEKTKAERLKWAVSSMFGISSDNVQYIGDGWLEVSAQRKTAIDTIEPVRYAFNPFRWLFFSEGGYISRWQEKSSSYVISPVVCNERGEVWVKSEGDWYHGKIMGGEIEWDESKRLGVSPIKVTGHEISTQDKKIYIKDK